MVGEEVEVVRFDVGPGGRGIVAHCRRGRRRFVVDVLALECTSWPDSARWIEAYRAWLQGAGSLDRQRNAGMNILKTALASDEALARAVWFQPGALRRDVVIPLYDLLQRGGAREEPSGVDSLAGVI